MQSIKRNGTLFTFYTSWPIEDLSIPKDKLLKGKAFQKYFGLSDFSALSEFLRIFLALPDGNYRPSFK